LEFCRWLEATPWSVALIESTYMWLIVETAHVLFLCVFVGLAAVLDIRLLGISFKKIPVSELAANTLPWMVGGFILMAISGLLLFYSKPVRNYANIFFRVKLILLVLAGLNAWIFHNGIWHRVSKWDRDPIPPKRARLAGAMSLTLWALIIIMGRLIAYNWFDKIVH
jgi:hypothetical protein